MQPLIDITVEEDKYCPFGSTSIWTKMWAGTVQGCDCSNTWSASLWKKHLQRDDGCWDDDEYRCIYEPSRMAVLQEEINDVYICGVRGGNSFAAAVRPDVNNECPSGFKPCNKNTDAQSTTCYDTTKGTTATDECPITGIQFVAKADADTFIANKKSGTGSNSTSDKEEWKKVEFDDDQVIVYTKDSNSLPVMATKLEYAPCMNPNQMSISPGQSYYALEVMNDGCKVDSNSGLTVDPRY